MTKKIINIFFLKFLLILMTIIILLTSCSSINYDEELLDLAGVKLQIEEFAAKEISDDKSSAIIYLDDKLSYAYIFIDSVKSDESIDEYYVLEEMVKTNPKLATENVKNFFELDTSLINVSIVKKIKKIKFKNKLLFKTILTMESIETDEKLKCDFYETVVDGRHTIFSFLSTNSTYNANKKKFERMLETLEFKEDYGAYN